MRQPEDNKTIDMLEPKRGRGRPRLENALTPAERARRYRERKAELRDLLSRDAAKPVTEKDNKVFRLECEIVALKNQLESYCEFNEQRRELDDHAQRQFDDVMRENQALESENKELKSQILRLEADYEKLRTKYVEAHRIAGQLVKSRLSKKGMSADAWSQLLAAFEKL